MTKKEKEQKIALYLFTDMKNSFIKYKVKCSDKLIEEVREKTDLSICPNCHGAEHVRHKNTDAMEPCWCRIRRIDMKYFKPLHPFSYQEGLITEKGLPDYSKNLHRIIQEDYSTDEIKFLFSYMLHKAKRPKYKYLTVLALRDISFGENPDYPSLTKLNTPVVLINAVIPNGSDKYLNLLDNIMVQFLFIRENAGLPVWIFIPKNVFYATQKYNQEISVPSRTPQSMFNNQENQQNGLPKQFQM